ncbi:MAG: hydantoinase/oxoprolinase family protein, partial [Cyanobacteria bacterium J06639_18]
YGMGLADIRAMRERGVEKVLNEKLVPELQQLMKTLEQRGKEELSNGEVSAEIYEREIIKKLNLKYEGTSSTLSVNFIENVETMRLDFEKEHKLRYGFVQSEKALIAESGSVEVIQKMDTPAEPLISRTRGVDEIPQAVEVVKMFSVDRWYDTPVYRREDLQPGDTIKGSAIIVEKISTIVVEPEWEAKLTQHNHLILECIA